MQFDNNNVFDIIAEKMNINFDYAKKQDAFYVGFDKVKHIFMQYT